MLHLFNEESPPFSFPSSHFPPSESVYKSLVLLVASSPISLSMVLVVLYILFYSIHKVLLIMSPHHFYLLLILSYCLQLFPFMFLTPLLKRKSDYLIISCCQIFSSSFTSHLLLMAGDVMWLIVESIFLDCLFTLSFSWISIGVKFIFRSQKLTSFALITHFVTFSH